MKVAIAFSSRDRVELSKQSIGPLLQRDLYDTWWIDGSDTPEGQALPNDYTSNYVRWNVRGGADAAIVYSLTTLLAAPEQYDVVGLCENDVLLAEDWFARTMALFERGDAEGLEVGAVSPRCYEDRILFQRDGFAVCHNLGAGVVLFTRKAAEIALANFRTSLTTENRLTFARLAGVDIGTYWAFRAFEHNLCADWGVDRVLASHGYASLALTPSPVEMIGQVPDLQEQGLIIAKYPLESRRNDALFNKYASNLTYIRNGLLQIYDGPFQRDVGGTLFLPHQVGAIGGRYDGSWCLQWSQGFGPFSWRSEAAGATLRVPLIGGCTFLVSGGVDGADVEIRDTHTGYMAAPLLPSDAKMRGQITNLPVPPTMTRREIILTATTPGLVFYGLKTGDSQAIDTAFKFDHTVLPPVAGEKR